MARLIKECLATTVTWDISNLCGVVMRLPFYSYYRSLVGNILNYFNNCTDDHDIDIDRKVLLVKLFSTIGFVFLLAFGLSSFFDGRYFIASAVLGAASATIANFLVFIRTENYARACNGVSIIIVSLSLFLLLTGGVEGTGPLWAYASVPLVLFLQGEEAGLKVILAFIFAATIMMFVPSGFYAYSHYSVVFKTRFLVSYIAVVILSWFSEYARNQAHQRWRDLSDYLADQARTDVLTGISNRRDILEKLEYENLRSKRRNESYTVLLIDVDRFKGINDTYGHDAGDVVLKEVSAAIKRVLFERDLLGRWGGEEFIVIMPDTDLIKGSLGAEKIRQCIEDLEICCDKAQIKVTVSIGLSTSDQEYQFYKYMKLADSRLYQAKAQGRNCVVGSLFEVAAKNVS